MEHPERAKLPRTREHCLEVRDLIKSTEVSRSVCDGVATVDREQTCPRRCILNTIDAVAAISFSGRGEEESVERTLQCQLQVTSE